MSGASIAGLKLTHDSGLAVIRGHELDCVTELEKVDSNSRYARIAQIEQVSDLLAVHEVASGDVDTWVIDGWFTEGPQPADPSLEVHASPHLIVEARGRPMRLPVAAYRELDGKEPLEGISVRRPLPGLAGSYRSHNHTTGHLASGYCTSPFAARQRPAAVLVWDGGVAPRLYVVDPKARTVRSLGAILPLKGNAYIEVVSRFHPFRLPGGVSIADFQRHQLSAPGKAMAYAGLGTAHEGLLEEIERIYRDLAEQVPFVMLPLALADSIEESAGKLAVEGADAIHTWQVFLGNLLEEHLARVLAGHEFAGLPLVLTGGCALNISWNSQLRDSGRFGAVWVPPFPNDSGSALGTACAELMRVSSRWVLEWDVYSGPRLRDEAILPGWEARQAEIGEVAALLQAGTVVMILLGRAELGPRALGHRSILAPATDRGMLDLLNTLKLREPYRPVAPICLEERASEVFDPGGSDPYMLFQHRIRPAWRGRIPAVSHVDGTARLQTVSREQEPTIHELLRCYERLSGIPVLCNTSANLPGRGFFPSVRAALAWGKTGYVWSEGLLYTRRPS
jgi:carbamoyltransferase